METLKLKRLHQFESGPKKYFFDPNTLLVGQLDSVSSEIVTTLKEGDKTNADIIRTLTPPHSKKTIVEAIQELRQIGLILTKRPPLLKPVPPPKIADTALNSIILHVANDCNLRCSYCFASGGIYGEERCLMDWQTAKESVDFLMKNSDSSKELSIIFFGGEPLLNFPLIKRIVRYCKELERKSEIRFTYGITTNGTLFNKENVEFMKRNKFNFLVSIDGTKEIHDRYRVFPTGQGSYDLIVKKLKKFFNGENIPARCTLPYDCFDLQGSLANLKKLRIGTAHFELAEGDYDIKQVMKVHLPMIKDAFSAMASKWKSQLTDNNFFLFRNLFECMKRIHFRQFKLIGCGAGRNSLAVSVKGNLYPCSRGIGNKRFSVGDLRQGLLVNAKEVFDLKTVNEKQECDDCIAKYLCGGGCSFQNYAENKDINDPNQLQCELTRHIIQLGLVLYVKLAKKKSFLECFSKESSLAKQNSILSGKP